MWPSAPTAKRLASASWDATVKVWDAATGQELLSLKGHTNWVYSVAFSPDGRRLASAGEDATVKLWDSTPITPESLGRDDALQLTYRRKGELTGVPAPSVREPTVRPLIDPL